MSNDQPIYTLQITRYYYYGKYTYNFKQFPIVPLSINIKQTMKKKTNLWINPPRSYSYNFHPINPLKK